MLIELTEKQWIRQDKKYDKNISQAANVFNTKRNIQMRMYDFFEKSLYFLLKKQ